MDYRLSTIDYLLSTIYYLLSTIYYRLWTLRTVYLLILLLFIHLFCHESSVLIIINNNINLCLFHIFFSEIQGLFLRSYIDEFTKAGGHDFTPFIADDALVDVLIDYRHFLAWKIADKAVILDFIHHHFSRRDIINHPLEIFFDKCRGIFSWT